VITSYLRKPRAERPAPVWAATPGADPGFLDQIVCVIGVTGEAQGQSLQPISIRKELRGCWLVPHAHILPPPPGTLAEISSL
jgi:hypothetical protein